MTSPIERASIVVRHDKNVLVRPWCPRTWRHAHHRRSRTSAETIVAVSRRGPEAGVQTGVKAYAKRPGCGRARRHAKALPGKRRGEGTEGQHLEGDVLVTTEWPG